MWKLAFDFSLRGAFENPSQALGVDNVFHGSIMDFLALFISQNAEIFIFLAFAKDK